MVKLESFSQAGRISVSGSGVPQLCVEAPFAVEPASRATGGLRGSRGSALGPMDPMSLIGLMGALFTVLWRARPAVDFGLNSRNS